MLKKIALAGVLAMGMMVTGQAKVAPTTYVGNGTPAYFDYNTNFPQMYSRMGRGQWMGQYMDRTSAVIVEQTSSKMIIAVNTFFVSKADTSNPSIYGYTTRKFLYDLVNKRLYVLEDNGNTRRINPSDAAAVTRGSIQPAEAAYYILTGQKFFGNKHFDQDLYDRL